ncbi:hypothetical protein Tco_1031347 [Tanacetum coccineum]|uniref:Uncharacterized protein n=1 Tax=Tanacetum coccineum TaxID=301880 RepID=A0ABQ5G8Q7_9ASTR
MNVCQPIPITPDVPILETVNSLKMGEVHFDTSKDSFESSVRDSFSIPRESNDLSNGVIEDFQNERSREAENEKNSNSETIADVPIKDSLLMVDEQINTTPSTEEIQWNLNSRVENVLFEQNEEFSSYDESSSKVENKFDTFKCFSNPLFELDEEIISLEKDAFQNEVISNQEKINDTCETEEDLKFFDDLLNEDPLFPDVFNVENDFQDYKEEIDISCDMIPPGIDTDDDSEGDVPPFEEPLDDGLFPLPEVDILPIKVEPVEVMFNDSHTYGENISQVERKILSMVDELFNLSNDDETFDPGGGENDVLLNKGENNDLNVLTIRTFLPFVTYPEVLPTSYSTGSEDKVFNPGIFDNDAFKDKSSKELAPSKALLTLDVFVGRYSRTKQFPGKVSHRKGVLRDGDLVGGVAGYGWGVGSVLFEKEVKKWGFNVWGGGVCLEGSMGRKEVLVGNEKVERERLCEGDDLHRAVQPAMV